MAVDPDSDEKYPSSQDSIFEQAFYSGPFVGSPFSRQATTSRSVGASIRPPYNPSYDRGQSWLLGFVDSFIGAKNQSLQNVQRDRVESMNPSELLDAIIEAKKQNTELQKSLNVLSRADEISRRKREEDDAKTRRTLIEEISSQLENSNRIRAKSSAKQADINLEFYAIAAKGRDERNASRELSSEEQRQIEAKMRSIKAQSGLDANFHIDQLIGLRGGLLANSPNPSLRKTAMNLVLLSTLEELSAESEGPAKAKIETVIKQWTDGQMFGSSPKKVADYRKEYNRALTDAKKSDLINAPTHADDTAVIDRLVEASGLEMSPAYYEDIGDGKIDSKEWQTDDVVAGDDGEGVESKARVAPGTPTKTAGTDTQAEKTRDKIVANDTLIQTLLDRYNAAWDADAGSATTSGTSKIPFSPYKNAYVSPHHFVSSRGASHVADQLGLLNPEDRDRLANAVFANKGDLQATMRFLQEQNEDAAAALADLDLVSPDSTVAKVLKKAVAKNQNSDADALESIIEKTDEAVALWEEQGKAIEKKRARFIRGRLDEEAHQEGLRTLAEENGFVSDSMEKIVVYLLEQVALGKNPDLWERLGPDFADPADPVVDPVVDSVAEPVAEPVAKTAEPVAKTADPVVETGGSVVETGVVENRMDRIGRLWLTPEGKNVMNTLAAEKGFRGTEPEVYSWFKDQVDDGDETLWEDLNREASPLGATPPVTAATPPVTAATPPVTAAIPPVTAAIPPVDDTDPPVSIAGSRATDENPASTTGKNHPTRTALVAYAEGVRGSTDPKDFTSDFWKNNADNIYNIINDSGYFDLEVGDKVVDDLFEDAKAWKEYFVEKEAEPSASEQRQAKLVSLSEGLADGTISSDEFTKGVAALPQEAVKPESVHNKNIDEGLRKAEGRRQKLGDQLAAGEITDEQYKAAITALDEYINRISQ